MLENVSCSYHKATVVTDRSRLVEYIEVKVVLTCCSAK